MSTEPATEPVSDPTALQESIGIEAIENKAAPTATATKKPAPKQRATKKSPVKKRQRVAMKKAAVQKRVAKKATVKKKKSTANKRTTKKAPAKRVAAKKTVVKKSAAKKSTKKKSVARAVTAKKFVAKKRAATKIVAKKPVPSKTEIRPNSNGVNKAQAIRDMAKELGGTPRPRDVIAALAVQGITVVSAQVSMVLKAAGLRSGLTTTVSGQHQPANLGQLFQVKHVADQVGGIEKLRELFGTLRQLL